MGLDITKSEFINLYFLPKFPRLWYAIWWKFMTASEIVLPLPKGYTEPDENGVSFDSSDPNSHWRPALERYVGIQHIDWDWAINDNTYNDVIIKFRHGKKDWATYFKLKWSK